MNKSTFKKAIVEMMNNYKFTLEQAAWSLKKMNPEWIMLINEAELELLTKQLLDHK